VTRGKLGATFFEHVISCKIIFRSWAKKFLPPMETPWLACQNCFLRDQTIVMGKVCFKKTKPFLISFGPWAKDYGAIASTILAELSKLQSVCLDEKNSVQKIFIFIIVFRLSAYTFLVSNDSFFWEGCQKLNLCLQKSFLKRW